MTSEMITTSKRLVGERQVERVALHRGARWRPPGASPASFIAANHFATSRISSPFWSRATTWAPRR